MIDVSLEEEVQEDHSEEEEEKEVSINEEDNGIVSN
jgi:hypothetical protein